MTSTIVPPVDLAPGMPSRVVTISATDVTEGGQSLEGQMVRFALSDTLDVSSGGDVIAKTQAEVVLDSNGEGSIRLPVYDEDVKTWCGKDWAILVTATWGSQKAVRVPAGTSSIALSALPPVRPLRGRERQWAITGVSLTVTEGPQAGGTASLQGGLLDIGITVPPFDPDAVFPYIDVATDFVSDSSNLLDLAGATIGYSIDAATGGLTPNINNRVTRFIRVVEGETYHFTDLGRWAFYDSNRDLVRTLDTNGPVVAAGPWARFAVHKDRLSTAKVNLGGVGLPYEPHYTTLNPSVGAEQFASSAALAAVEDMFRYSTNLLDTRDLSTGYTLNATTGEPSAHGDYTVTGFVPVKGDTAYTLNEVWRYGFYDTNRGFLVSQPGGAGGSQLTITTPSNAAYARWVVKDPTIAQVNEGTDLLPFEPFYVDIPALKSTGSGGGGGGASTYLVDTDGLGETYDAPTMPAQPGLDATTTADVHGWYDQLVADHPDYVSRRDLGVASDGTNHLYAYTFRPEPVPTEPDGTESPGLATPAPVALFVSGVHGFEKAAVWSLWRFAQALCEEWADSPALDAIRWNIEVVIVPVGSPYSYDQSTPGVAVRKNFNGVDIARNFEAGWVLNPDPASNQYGGPSPLSEPEAVMLDALMAEVAPRAVVGSSFHCFSTSSAVSNAVIWQASASRLMLDLGKQVISRMSRKWHREHAWITETRTYLGYADDGAPPGSEGRQMEAYGYPGATFETSRSQLLDGGAGERHTSEAMTLGFDATVNYIAMAIQTGLGRQ